MKNFCCIAVFLLSFTLNGLISCSNLASDSDNIDARFDMPRGTFTGTGTVTKYTFTHKDYPYSKDRNYEVYVPQGLVAGTRYPMLMVLHGCAMEDSAPGSTVSDALREWNLDLIADSEKVILVLPFLKTTDYPAGERASNCWGWWRDEHRHAGAGEAEDIHQIAMAVEASTGTPHSGKIDPNRRYVTGLSAGGAMAIIQATAYNRYWAAIAAAEALPYGESSNCVTYGDIAPKSCTSVSNLVTAARNELKKTADYRMVPMMEIHSLNDTVADFNPNAPNIRKVALTIFGSGPDQAASETFDCTYEGISCEQKRYKNSSNKVIIETRYYNGDKGPQSGSLGGGHYWVGDDGSTDNWSYDKGPVNSTGIWAFLKDKTLVDKPPTPPTAPTNLEPSNITYKSFTLSWTAATDNVSISGYEVVNADNNAAMGHTSTTSYDVTGLIPSTAYRVKVKAFDNENTPGPYSDTLRVTTAAAPPDIEPPSVPTGLTASNIGPTSFVLSWTASTDDITGVSGYEVFQSLSQDSGYASIGTVTETSKPVSGLTANTPYYFKVRAYDAKPNYSALSAYKQVKTNPAGCNSCGQQSTWSLKNSCCVSAGCTGFAPFYNWCYQTIVSTKCSCWQ